MATARGPIPNRPPRRIALPSAGRIAGVAVLALVAALIGWLAHSPATKTVTRTTVQPPATIYEHTPAGAVAAAEASLVQAETSCLEGLERCQSPAAYSLGPDRGGLWSLAYRVKSFTPTVAMIEAWQVGVAAGGNGRSQLAWQLADVPVRWTGTEWREDGQVSTNPSGPMPPANGTSGPASETFARQIAGFRRFAGAP